MMIFRKGKKIGHKYTVSQTVLFMYVHDGCSVLELCLGCFERASKVHPDAYETPQPPNLEKRE